MSSGPLAARDAALAVLGRLPEVPAGPELVSLAGRRGDLALVGGAVRDLLLGRTPRELDVVLDGDAGAFATELASLLGDAGDLPASRSVHERFGTAVVEWEGGRVDIARRRAETYRAPGALPDVSPGTAEEDLARRDFTVNAIAVALGGPRRGELSEVPHALSDLAAGLLRVLHERSFLDDPTRLLRLGRYGARLSFAVEERTAALAAQALQAGALDRVSGARVGAELRLALGEADPVASLARLDELGVLAGVDRALRFDAPLARRALALLPLDGRPAVLLLAVLLAGAAATPCSPPAGEMAALLDRLEFPAGERDAAVRAAVGARTALARIPEGASPSEVCEALGAETLEAVLLAVAGASGASDGAATAARRWLEAYRHVRLSISGEDLLAAGVPAGPEIGERLTAALKLRLDGRLSEGREASSRRHSGAAHERLGACSEL